MKTPQRAELTVADYVAGVRACNRAILARAITLVESSKKEHELMAQEVLQALLPFTGQAHRIGLTGVPGVGKSTAIDQLGTNLTDAGHALAVLAVDPTSTRTGGSILGDKTRMARLSGNPRAFIRPSPTSGTLGGVARKTRETMALCEAAGFDIVIIETVGVGQSEVAVAEMVDIFVVMLLAGGGDDLQGIKKGVIEIADIIAINKADGDNVVRAQHAASDYRGALNILTPVSPAWSPPVLIMSGQDNTGLNALWDAITAHKAALTASGEFKARREEQAVQWMRGRLQAGLYSALKENPAVAAALPSLEDDVRKGRVTPVSAANTVLALAGLAGRATNVDGART
jgi:LAO/AO transport system kinase